MVAVWYSLKALYWSVTQWLGTSAAYIQWFIIYLVISQRHAEEGLAWAFAAEINGIVVCFMASFII